MVMKKVIVLIVLLVLAVAGYFGYQIFYPAPVTTNPPSTTTSPTGTPQVTTYTLAQIAEHGSSESCWMAIEGKVYDMTPFVKSGFHPGKDAILQGCGKNATELFNTRPTGTGTPHSERARSMLPKYFIGDFAQ
jgi:cytochrome b involved in lipid metabolism